MKNYDENPDKEKHLNGYRVEGDGTPENDPPQPGNASFEENPKAMTHKNPADIPGKEFNTGDKAFFDSSKSDFVETVSKLHHADDFPEKK